MATGEVFVMILKFTGAALIILACGGVGFRMAAIHRQEEKALQQLLGILDYMECELQYRLTTLPELCRQAANEFNGIPGKVLFELISEMESQVAPDITCCMQAVLGRNKEVPPITRKILELLGTSIGRYDLDGQLKGLESVRYECRRNIELLSNNKDTRLRSYQTLGLCAGAALAILLI